MKLVLVTVWADTSLHTANVSKAFSFGCYCVCLTSPNWLFHVGNMHCANNGTCYEGYCSCPYGYNGQYCQTSVCVCVCVCCVYALIILCPKYAASNAYVFTGVSQCNGTTCYNNGTCDGGSCSCPYPYTGHDCTAYECEFENELHVHTYMCHGAGAKVGWIKEYRRRTFTM